MNYRMFLRMAKWAHNPPSAKRVVMVLSIIAACLVLFAVERFIGLPDWMLLERARAPKFPVL